LMSFLAALGRDIEIVVRPARDGGQHGCVCVSDR
jgi:hypothetical protein